MTESPLKSLFFWGSDDDKKDTIEDKDFDKKFKEEENQFKI
jgi:hypothetical protein